MALFPRLTRADDAPAVTVGDVTLSYAELARAADARIAALSRDGVHAGDRVGVWTEPTLDTIVSLVANVRLGAITVPLNPKLGDRERQHVLARATGRGPAGAALILHTSGTTGAPKGAVLTWANIEHNLDALAAVWAWTERDTLAHALPLFHVHGLVLGLFGTLRLGGHLRWLPRFSPSALAAALAAGASMVFAVPTMYHRLANAGEDDPAIRRALASARLLVSGSAGLPAREHQRLGVPIYERYGLTETLINCAVPVAGPPRPGYVGPPLPGVELALVDDRRRPIDARDDATLGEVAVRGPNVFGGYLDDPAATAAVRDDDGWFYTGDVATRTADGAIRIHGRRDTDLIKTGGFKVGAGEIEACLLDHPAVAEAAVVGLPDDDLGERIAAFVVARGDASPDALIEHVAAALAPHKRPREVHLVTALPRNPMGKVQKQRLLRGHH